MSWANSLSIAIVGTSILILPNTGASQQPIIEGDSALIQLLRDAQQANLDRFTSGEVKARYSEYFNSSSEPGRTILVHCIWDDEKAYWDASYEFGGDVEIDDPAKKKMLERTKPVPYQCRTIFDGKQYFVYKLTDGTGSGTIYITDKAGSMAHVWSMCLIDQRPKSYWSLKDGARPWSHFLGPHPAFSNDKVEKWVVRRASGNLVEIERHDATFLDGTKQIGLLKVTTSLPLAGNVVSFSYAGFGERNESRYVWERDADGNVILVKSEMDLTFRSGSRSRICFELLEIDLHKPANASQFTIAALKPRPGTQVVDEVKKTRYTYDVGQNTQERLDELGTILKRNLGKAK